MKEGSRLEIETIELANQRLKSFRQRKLIKSEIEAIERVKACKSKTEDVE